MKDDEDDRHSYSPSIAEADAAGNIADGLELVKMDDASPAAEDNSSLPQPPGNDGDGDSMEAAEVTGGEEFAANQSSAAEPMDIEPSVHDHHVVFPDSANDLVPGPGPAAGADAPPASIDADAAAGQGPGDNVAPDPVAAAAAAAGNDVAPAAAVGEAVAPAAGDNVVRAAAGRPAEDPYPDDLPLEALLPRRPAADRGPRAAPAYSLTWTDIRCRLCHRICGQMKFSPGPSRHGDSDPPTWFMRVKTGNVWPSTAPNFRRRQASVVGNTDDFAKNWIHENRHCCRHAD